jgi:hypothetical protein
MSAEHLNEEGKLVGGYWCAKCGKPTSMMGHTKCKPNPELVKRVREINEAGSIEQYTFNRLKKR